MSAFCLQEVTLAFCGLFLAACQSGCLVGLVAQISSSFPACVSPAWVRLTQAGKEKSTDHRSKNNYWGSHRGASKLYR